MLHIVQLDLSGVEEKFQLASAWLNNLVGPNSGGEERRHILTP